MVYNRVMLMFFSVFIISCVNKTIFDCKKDIIGKWDDKEGLYIKVKQKLSIYSLELGGGPIQIKYDNLTYACNAKNVQFHTSDKKFNFKIISKRKIELLDSPKIDTNNSKHFHNLSNRSFFPNGTMFTKE